MSENNRNGLPSSNARLVVKTSEELNIHVSYSTSAEVFNERYVQGEKLGGGGFGCVYRGTCRETLESAVIKEIDSARVPCWCRLDGVLVPLEVVLLTKVNQLPGIVKLLDVFNLQNNWYIVMKGNKESVCDMFDYICERGTLNEAESAFIMYQLIGILLQCHVAGVLHRDLKDENLLIDRRTKEIQLIDFGSGAFLHDEEYTDFDGTRVYCPPEWINRNAYYGKPAEVWSVGVLLFDMLNGDVPFINDKGITSGRLRFRRDGLSEVVRNLMHCCMHRDAEMRPTLLQILHHPWLLRYRHIVGRQSPLSAQYAISQASMGITPHLSTSVTVRSGLNSLAHGVHRHSVDGAVSVPPVQVVKVVGNTAPAFAQAIAADSQTTVGATSHLSTSVTVRSGLNSLAHEVHRQSVDGAVSVPPLQIVKVVGNATPAVGVDGQFFRCPNDSQNAAPPQENCQLSELARAHSNGSYASSGYYTRSNSLCFEEERSKKGGFGIAYLMGNTQCSQPVLTDINDSQQWREKASTGSSTDSNVWRGAFRPPSCDSSKTIPEFHHSANISCTNLRCLDHVDSHPPQTTHSRSPDEGLPPNIFDGITISAARQSNESESRRTT